MALWQANYTSSILAELGIKTELIIIKTKGDKIQHLSFDKIEGKGFFTREIEEALLRGDIDIAVHSMKDLPTTSPEGLVITAVSYRENPADWLVINQNAVAPDELFQLKKGAIVGTSSARRKALLLDFRKDITLKDIRGNVPTRLQKLQNDDFDAIVLAGAGLSRLEMDLSGFFVFKFNPKEFVPAPAQGVLAFQTCTDDVATRRIFKKIHQSEVSAVTNVERKILKLLGGGCHMPMGAYCEKDSMGNYHVWAAKAEQWDSPLKRTRLSSSTTFQLAEKIVEQLQ